jgi:macrolide transport system ATP-binding/permease protein
MIARLRLFIRSLFRRRQFEGAMSDELRFHIDAHTEDLVRAGVPHAEARRRARAEFGGVESVKEECRQARGLRLADELRQDVRYAVRTMARAPMVTAAVVGSLALGIGANTALFGFVDAVFLRALPVRSPHELFYLGHHSGPETSSNYPLYERYGELDDVFAGLTAYLAGTFNVTAGDALEPVTGQWVSGNYHAVVGAPIVLGRGFSSEPDRDVSRAALAIISDAYWARAFGRSPGAVGSTITVNGRPVEIVGVTGPGFYGFDSQSRADITLPLAAVGLDNPEFFDDHGTWMSLRLVGRLKPGVPEGQALAAADVVFRQFMREPEQQWVRQGPNTARFSRAALLSAARGSEGRRELTEQPIRLLVAMAGILLLIACANVANLLLVRGAARRREVAVRAGIGAGRSRLIRQFATEGMLLALCGGLLGLPVAAWTSSAILSVLDAGPTPFLLDVTLDVRTLAFTLLLSGITGVGFALFPAIRATAPVRALAPALRNDMGTPRRRFATGGSVLVASQIALCVLLLVATGLLSRSLFNLRTLDAGFVRTEVLLADVSTRGAEFTPERRMTLYDSLLEQVGHLPGVVSVSSSTRTPIDLSSRNNRIVVPGVEVKAFQGVSPNVVSPDFFRTLGIRLVRGRAFTRDDRVGQPRVAVVSEGMARFYFGAAEPLGRTIMLGSDEPITIVGVVGDVRHERLTEATAPRMVYTPLAQTGVVGPFGDNAVPARITLVAHVDTDPRTIGAALRAAARRIDPAAMVSYVRTMDEQFDAALVRERLLAVLSAGISALSLLLACVGLYGTLSYTVVRRSREIGIRMALGAARLTVLAEILKQCVMMAACGILVGGLASLWASRALSTFLFGLSPRDPGTLAAATALLLVTACLAGYLPARRAASVDPARVLKAE